MKGFTLIELIVVVAIMALAAMVGTHYYFTNVEMYRFQKVLTDFKSSLNLARVRSISGRMVSSGGGIVGLTPAAIPLATMQINGNIVTLTRTASLPTLISGLYVTLQGLYPENYVQNFPYSINGCLYKVTSSSGNALTLELLNQDPDNYMNVNTPSNKKPNFTPFLDPISNQATPVNLKSSAYAFFKYAVWIKPVTSIDGGGYSEVSETGPEMEFKYNQNTIKVEVTLETPTESAKQDQPCMILFDKGRTVACQTYKVTVALQKSGAVSSSVNILSTGAVH
jgi:prepilin-type N-terminal cleavage/methylation domain-containing protein